VSFDERDDEQSDQGPLSQALVDGGLAAAVLWVELWATGVLTAVGTALLLLAAAAVGLLGLLLR
jgi:hypothetical protein